MDDNTDSDDYIVSKTEIMGAMDAGEDYEQAQRIATNNAKLRAEEEKKRIAAERKRPLGRIKWFFIDHTEIILKSLAPIGVAIVLGVSAWISGFFDKLI
jgi:hypothetical protein